MVATEQSSSGNAPPSIKSFQASTACHSGIGEGYTTNVQRNANLGHCDENLFFLEVFKKLATHRAKYPNAKIINCGVGDVTEPIPNIITSAMEKYACGLSTPEGFSGYDSAKLGEPLRNRIAEVLYKGLGVKASEIVLSDGAKGSLTRLQILFGPQVTMAVPDPSYPIPPVLCKLIGQGSMLGSNPPNDKNDKRVVHMKCIPEQNFFPDLSSVPRTDIIYLCNPNNPTGITATRGQLEELVTFARKNGSIIVCDAVYSCFVTDECPKSIYEIPGAREVAIEVGSFSKFAGFTGVRLGWAIVPDVLAFADGRSVLKDYLQVTILTFPAGPSNIAQAGGIACLSPEGVQALNERVEFYKENGRILIDLFGSLGLKVVGGKNSPYLWVEFPGRSSRDLFDEILEKAHIATTPGILFGTCGEGFLRFSSFGHREDVLEAARRLRDLNLSCKS